MNKRNFFKSLALMAGAASISPQIFIPKFEPVKWKASTAFEEILVPFDFAFPSQFFGKWDFVTTGTLIHARRYPHNAGNVLRHEDIEKVARDFVPWEL